ncbi:MAG: hypothetical protein ACI3W5_14400 [Faecousia sp.]
MPRRDPATRICSKVFRAAMDEYKKTHCAPGAKNYEVDSALAKVLPEQVAIQTIRTWRYKRNPAVGAANLEAINHFLSCDCSLKSTEEESDMHWENKPLTVQGQLALEIYQHIFSFVDSITFDSSLDEVEANYFELLRTFESREAFLSTALKDRLEKALDEIAVPLTDEDVFSTEYTPEIGHFTGNIFHADNLALLVRTHEEVMLPYRNMLRKLAEDLRSML